MAVQERSAGVIIVRGTGTDARYLLLDYGRYWDFAKGHVEPGESDRDAALRETREETGLQVRLIDGFAHELTYFFRHKSKGLIRKTVIFFLGRPIPPAAATEAALNATEASPKLAGAPDAAAEPDGVILSHEHVGHTWLPLDEAMRTVKFAGAKEVLRLAGEFLRQHREH